MLPPSSLLLLLVGCPPQEDPFPYTLDTPLDVPCAAEDDGVVDIADPHVVRHDGAWILYATCSDVDLEAWSSTDLVTWTSEGIVWAPESGSWAAEGEIWAPHVEPVDDRWYLYYTADLRIGVATADSPLGPFTDALDHPLFGNGYGGVGDGVEDSALDWEEWTIDAFLHVDTSGASWMVHTTYDPLSRLVSTPMEDPLTPADSGSVILLEPQESWEGAIVEAPWVLQEGDTRILLYSGNRAETEDYAVGAATATSLETAFTRLSEEPLLASDPDRERWGPGHVSVVEGANDDRLLFYHAKVDDDDGFERRLRYTTLQVDEGTIQLGEGS